MKSIILIIALMLVSTQTVTAGQYTARIDDLIKEGRAEEKKYNLLTTARQNSYDRVNELNGAMKELRRLEKEEKEKLAKEDGKSKKSKK